MMRFGVAVSRLAVLCWSLLCTPTLTHGPRKGVWRRVEAVSGREAVLPCEVGSLHSSDMVFVVLWYRNGHKEPFYSYDNRPGRLVQSPEDRHTIKSQLLEGRATFRPGQVPALHIKPVLTTDQANYTCRVDFRIASSRRTHLILQVVEPPGQPVVRFSGRRVAGDVLGPLQENDALAITCTVAGGVPSPSLLWLRQGQVIDGKVESRTGAITVNQLKLPRLSRDFHNSRFSCLATNNNVTSPAITAFTITLNHSLSALQATVSCTTDSTEIRTASLINFICAGSPSCRSGCLVIAISMAMSRPI